MAALSIDEIPVMLAHMIHSSNLVTCCVGDVLHSGMWCKYSSFLCQCSYCSLRNLTTASAELPFTRAACMHVAWFTALYNLLPAARPSEIWIGNVRAAARRCTHCNTYIK